MWSIIAGGMALLMYYSDVGPTVTQLARLSDADFSEVPEGCNITAQRFRQAQHGAARARGVPRHAYGGSSWMVIPMIYTQEGG